MMLLEQLPAVSCDTGGMISTNMGYHPNASKKDQFIWSLLLMELDAKNNIGHLFQPLEDAIHQRSSFHHSLVTHPLLLLITTSRPLRS
jgi:hypothetical protein